MGENLKKLLFALANISLSVASSNAMMDAFNAKWFDNYSIKSFDFDGDDYEIINKSHASMDLEGSYRQKLTVRRNRAVIPGILYKYVQCERVICNLPDRNKQIIMHEKTNDKYRFKRFGQLINIGGICTSIYVASKYGSDYFSSLSNYLFSGKK